MVETRAPEGVLQARREAVVVAEQDALNERAPFACKARGRRAAQPTADAISGSADATTGSGGGGVGKGAALTTGVLSAAGGGSRLSHAAQRVDAINAIVREKQVLCIAARDSAGSNIEARIAMIAITTSSSIKVKPARG